MKALRVTDQRVYVADIPLPEANGEARVRVIKSGICNTDLEIARGYAGFNGTIGHEFVGVVESSSDEPKLAGTRVVGEINAGCGKCDLCVGGDSRHCPSRTVLGIHGRDGAHAEFLTLPSRNLIAVPESVSDEAAVFAEPLAAAYGIAERVDVGPGTSVAIIGDGKLGLLCAMTMQLRTDSVLMVGKHSEKMSIVEKLGVETMLLGKGAIPIKSFDVVIEASGSESGFSTALDLVRPRGSVILKSTFHGTASWEASRVVVDEISIVGSRCGRLAPAIELLASKKVNVDDLISDEYRLDDGVNALEQAGRHGVLKVLLRP
jgi:threonine dehydrogenase-like Zn-dependent dehydrogenase